MGNIRNGGFDSIDVDFIRKHKIPTDMNLLHRYNEVILDYIKVMESQINVNFLTEFNKWTWNLLNDWDRHALDLICGDYTISIKARRWFEDGEVKRGIIQEIDTICDVISLYY
jgi:hypothetical protein